MPEARDVRGAAGRHPARGTGRTRAVLFLLAVCAASMTLSFADQREGPAANAGAIPGRAVAALTAGAPNRPPGDADEKERKANQIKAVCLLRFASYVKWPGSAFDKKTSPLVMGIVGRDPFGPDLDRSVKGDKVQKRRIEIRRLGSFAGLKAPFPANEGEPVRNRISELKKCHILFVAPSERKNIAAILKSLDGAPILVAGDSAGFADSGVMVNFVIVKNRVRFEINLVAARKAGLEISSKVLELATRVIAKEVKPAAPAKKTPAATGKDGRK